jgi:hypothetical protein
MPALNDAVSQILSDTGAANLNRRLVQATLLDTNGDNAAAIEQKQMDTLARQAGVSQAYAVSTVTGNVSPTQIAGISESPKHER